MVTNILQGLGSTLGILDSAAGLLTKAKPAFDRANDARKRVGSAAQPITAVTAQTTILSRAFIDNILLQEAVLPNLMRAAHEWYSAQILAAFMLQDMITSKRTVQDVMAPVQTGHTTYQRNLMGSVAKRAMGQEAFVAAHLGEGATESYDSQDPLVLITKKEAEDLARRELEVTNRMKDVRHGEATNEERERSLKAKPNERSVQSVSASQNRIGPMGELFEVKLTNPNGTGQSVTVPVFVQIQPSLIDHDIAPRFIDQNVSQTLWQRWTQMTAGEISFWKDFVAGVDLIKRQRALLKDPVKAAAFNEFLKTVAKKDHYVISELTDKSTRAQSSNLANSIMIFSEDTLRQAKIDSGIDLHKPADRQRYFNDTYTMMLIVLDTLYQHVTIYFNGIDGMIEVPYNDFRPKDTKFDPKDFLTALQAFSTNSISRLR